MAKISIIGAGNVGATAAMRIIEHGLADVVLVDVKKELAVGKAFDISDASVLAGQNRCIIGTDEYKDVKDSEVVVVTAGYPRRPDMSREELIQRNYDIIKEVIENLKSILWKGILIMVTNPLDIMTYIAYKKGRFPRHRIMGMAGLLDTARFINLIIQQTNIHPKDVKSMVLGSHGDTMVPVISFTTLRSKPLPDFIGKQDLEETISATKQRGAQIVSLLKTASAYYAPSYAIFLMVEAIINDRKKTLPVSCILDGEYGLENLCIGVPAVLGKDGIEKICEITLEEKEREEFIHSAMCIKEHIKKISHLL